MTRGFVIMAQNTEKTDYVKCATALELSIKRVMPDANVTIITTDMLPHGDQAPDSDWKLINDWQVYEASPYDETIKLEADMFLPRSIEHWFDILSINDVTLCTKIRNYKGEISDVRVYRKFIDDNNLPDIYNAITYFKKSDTAEQFYKIVRENWTDTLVYELLPDVLRVHTYSQEYPFHYHSKSFSDKILERYKWNTL